MIINLIFLTVPPLRVEFDLTFHFDGSGEFGYDSPFPHTTYTKLHPPTTQLKIQIFFQTQPTGAETKKSPTLVEDFLYLKSTSNSFGDNV